ncbi:MAG: efflux RND transporter periplasmic adaptor subunit [bacterium]|nr:efflux RND transporter periplasmic adaptor subunit [bacterium]
MKRNIIIISILALLGCLMFFTSGCSKSIYQSAQIQKRSIVQTVDASGTVNPVKTVNIGSQVSGQIKEIYVDYNSVVKKGQLLAEIDPSLFQAQVDKAQGDLWSAQANYQKIKSTLDFDRKNYQRYKKLYTKNYVSKSDLDLAESTYNADIAQLNAMSASISQAQANLQNNLTNLGYTKIVSPVDGVVISKAVDVGQTVAASFQTPELFVVAQDLRQMQIEVSVSEADIGKIKAGQDVTYTLDGYPDEVFMGTVKQVRISPTTVSNVVTYTVIVSVDNEDDILIPGMTANVSIITMKKEDVLCVPNRALKFSPTEITGGKKYKEQGIWIVQNSRTNEKLSFGEKFINLFKNKSEKLERISVKIGASDGDYTEVISDELREGDNVVTGRIGDEDKRKGDFMPKMRAL